MKNYGLSGYQIKQAKKKLEFNRDYMLNHGVQIDNKMVPYSDFVTNSYTNSNRYIAELQHRAWSIYDYAKGKSLKNIFFTLTLPSKWHPKKTFKNKLVKNKKFAGRKFICTINKIKFLNAHVTQRFNGLTFEPILDFSETIDKYSPRNASKELSKMLKYLFNERSYRSIEKDDRCYFRVTEPHKDGTPHVHMSLFVPEDKVSSIVKSLTRLYPAPLGKIETEVNSPVSYLMKYVFKTLDDLRDEDADISNLTLWYLYHGISRFYTSRTFISLEIYRKLHGMYGLEDLTTKYLMDEVSVYVYNDTKKIAMIENEFGTIYVPKPVNWSEKINRIDNTSTRIKFKITTNLKQKFQFLNATVMQNIPFIEPTLDYDNKIDKNTCVSLDSGFESVYKEEKPFPITFKIGDIDFISYNFRIKQLQADNKLLEEIGVAPLPLSSVLIKQTVKPYQMNDFELYNYFHSLDIDTVDDKHYIYTRNLLIERGYHDGEWLKLTSVDEVMNFEDGEEF